MTLEIREERESDFPQVFELNKVAFERDAEAQLVELLRESDAFIPSLSLVATADHRVVGHILLTKIIIESSDNQHGSLALAPMAVRPDLQNRGIGRQLIMHGLNKARELGHKSVIVLGHEHYYPKFGFIPADRWKISCPYDVPPGAFMAVELVNDGLKGVTGTVKYPKEFDNV